MSDSDPLALARRLIERWNEGDIDGVVDLYAEDGVIVSQPDWPEPAWRGHDAIRQSIVEWRSVWEASKISVERLEPHGDRVVIIGAWQTRGRLSGLDGQIPFVVVLTAKSGKIASLEWFADHESAVAAARGT
jgi:ketosteroid isomerase-like protein